MLLLAKASRLWECKGKKLERGVNKKGLLVIKAYVFFFC